MVKIILTIAGFFILSTACGNKNCLGYVNPFICTSGDHGQLDPSATVPFGMIKLGPDTNPGNHSGYNYEATKIIGFSHNRIGGVGCKGAGGNLRVLPLIGKLGTESSFCKDNEFASSCYYSVKFDNNILAELTSTNQTGFHRYTFPESDEAYLMVDFASSFAGTISLSREIINNHEFNLKVSSWTVCDWGRYTVNYHVWCSKSLSNFTEQGDKVFFQFKTKNNEEILLHVTVSTIDTADARQEWVVSTKGLDFDTVKNQGEKKWESLLSKIEVEGKEEYKTIFYTYLYHLFLNPVKASNRANLFRATDGDIYNSKEYTHYDCWSMWDNFRNKFTLYPLLIPEVTSDIANSLINLYKYGKPYHTGYNESVPTVRTEHTIITLLDLYRRGITGFDIERAYKNASAEINNIYRGIQTPDKILEQSYDYWALAQIAKILDKPEDQELFTQEYKLYKKVWKEKFLHMGENSDIMHGDGLYEGTLWQYRWHAHFDIEGMIGMVGGEDKFCKELEYFFNNHLYSHGNQPDIHAPFLFNYGGKPWLTQKWVNKILTREMVQHYGTHKKWDAPYIGKIYKNEPEGYFPEMDDDEGTMSGWYVLASMGLYPVLVGEPEFQICSPIFEKITMHLPGDKEFKIITNGLNNEAFYIQSATFNGEPFNQPYIRHSDIARGGILEFNVSEVPNKKWGVELQ